MAYPGCMPVPVAVAMCPKSPKSLLACNLFLQSDGIVRCTLCNCVHEMKVYPAPTEHGIGPNNEFGNTHKPPTQWWLCANPNCGKYTVDHYGHCLFYDCGATHQLPK